MSTAIEYLTGDATAPATPGPKIIVHVCNDIGGWGRGFVLALSKKWPEPEQAYRAWHKTGENFTLGQSRFVDVTHDIAVANMIGQQGVRATKDGPPIRYDALRECLEQVADEAKRRGASVHMPRIGCGLAGGSWDEVGAIVEETLAARGIAVTVYDFG